MKTQGMHVVRPRAAGLDVHRMEITATVRVPVRMPRSSHRGDVRLAAPRSAGDCEAGRPDGPCPSCAGANPVIAQSVTGSGRLTLDLDGAVAQRYRTDLSMTLAAAGVRGDLLTRAEPGGFALKVDAFWMRTESDRVTTSRFGGATTMGAAAFARRVAVEDPPARCLAMPAAALHACLRLLVDVIGGESPVGQGPPVRHQPSIQVLSAGGAYPDGPAVGVGLGACAAHAFGARP